MRTGFRYVIPFLHTHGRSGISFLEVCEELGCQNHQNQCNRISCSVSTCNIWGTAGVDQRTQRRCAGHTAGDGTEVVEQAQLQHLLCQEEADEQRNGGHQCAPQEQQRAVLLQRFYETGTAVNAGSKTPSLSKSS